MSSRVVVNCRRREVEITKRQLIEDPDGVCEWLGIEAQSDEAAALCARILDSLDELDRLVGRDTSAVASRYFVRV